MRGAEKSPPNVGFFYLIFRPLPSGQQRILLRPQKQKPKLIQLGLLGILA